MDKNDEMDLSGRSDEDLENDMRKILEDDTFNNYNKYNNYSSNNIKVEVVREGRSNSKSGSLFGKIILFIGIIFLVIFIANFEEIFHEWNYDDNYEYEELYDIEYDLDENGYLDYEEQNTYELDKIEDFIKNFTVSELFIDRMNEKIFFEIENNNSYNLEFINLNVAFFDEEGKLLEVEESYIECPKKGEKIIDYVYCDKAFYKYDAVVTIDSYCVEENDSDINADVEIISNGYGIDESEIIYTLKNNSKDTVSGKIYVIFYDESNNIIYMDENIVFGLKPGKTEEFEAYLFGDLITESSRYEINLSCIEINKD